MKFSIEDVVQLKHSDGNKIAAKIVAVFPFTESYELETKTISFPLFLSEKTLLKLVDN